MKQEKIWQVRAKGVMHEGTMLESGHYIVKHWYGKDAGQVAIAFLDSYPKEMHFVELQVKEAKRHEGQEESERPGTGISRADRKPGDAD